MKGKKNVSLTQAFPSDLQGRSPPLGPSAWWALTLATLVGEPKGSPLLCGGSQSELSRCTMASALRTLG